MENKKNLVIIAMVALAAIIVMYGFVAAPPAPVDNHDHSEDQQSNVLEGVLNEIDKAAAKTITIQLTEISSEDCANQVASKLAALGSVGNIRCDMTKKLFDVEYDSKKLTEKQILDAFAEAQHPGTLVENS